MATPNVGPVRCRHVGEFLDEAPPVSSPVATGQVVRPVTVVEFVEEAVVSTPLKEFTVLLRDGRVVKVPGHRLSYVQHPNATDAGSYGVMARGTLGEELIALFRVTEVTGIFSGQLQIVAEKAATG
jgi:hypothetical protein